MKRLYFLITIVLLLYPVIGFSSEDDLIAIDQRISEIERRLELIQDKEKEYDALTREIDRAKYKVLIRRERELKAKRDEVSKELEELLKEKNGLIDELDELRAKRRMIQDQH